MPARRFDAPSSNLVDGHAVFDAPGGRGSEACADIAVKCGIPWPFLVADLLKLTCAPSRTRTCDLLLRRTFRDPVEPADYLVGGNLVRA